MSRIRLVSGTIFSLLMLTLLCHHLYGWQFIEETYLYHVTRYELKHKTNPTAADDTTSTTFIQERFKAQLLCLLLHALFDRG